MQNEDDDLDQTYDGLEGIFEKYPEVTDPDHMAKISEILANSSESQENRDAVMNMLLELQGRAEKAADSGAVARISKSIAILLRD